MFGGILTDGTPNNRTQLGNTLLGLLRTRKLKKSGFGALGKLRRKLARHVPLLTPGQLLASLMLGSLCGTGVVAILNRASGSEESGNSRFYLLFAFVVLVVIYRLAQGVLLNSVTEAIEHSLDITRLRIADKFTRLNLEEVERLPADILAKEAAPQYASISNAIIPLVISMQSSALLLLLLAYLFYISPVAAATVVLISLKAAHGFVVRLGTLNETLALAAKHHFRLLGAMSELWRGFKELRLDGRKRQAFMEDLEVYSTNVVTAQVGCASVNTGLVITGTSAAYLLGGAAVFLLPMLGGSDASTREVLTLVLFMMGPLAGSIGGLQQLATIRFAVDYIDAIERRLDSPARTTRLGEAPPFEQIEFTDVTYSHVPDGDHSGFAVGPLRLVLRAGSLTFLTGGNGSGKTTTLRLLTGLYSRAAGDIILNGRIVQAADLDDYRELFGTVFTDFHVFRRPYAMTEVQLCLFEATLTNLRIRHKLPDDIGQDFDPAKLSTGERKRLALAVAIAEQRPVLIFDEVAADQDPQFREEFYRKILPTLKAEKRTIFAVTHDERYFDAADFRYHIDEGQLSLVDSLERA